MILIFIKTDLINVATLSKYKKNNKSIYFIEPYTHCTTFHKLKNFCMIFHPVKFDQNQNLQL